MDRLLGREQELARLQSLLADAECGRGSLAVLSAEAGGGKTALLQAAARDAAGRLPVAWGDCPGSEAMPPFWPWLQVLRSLAREPAFRDPCLAAVAALQAQSRTEADRWEAFESVAEALASPEAPALVVIDDLHAADGASLRLLEFLAPPLRRSSVLVLLATRSNVPNSLRSVLGMLVRHGAVRLELAPFDAADVQEVLRESGASSIDARQVFAITGGNPLFVGEIARHARDHGSLESVPHSLVDLFRSELDALSPSARSLAEVASLVEGEIDAPLVLNGVGAEGEVLEELARAGLVRPLGAAYVFRHDVVREAIRVGLAQADRIAGYARLAEAADRLGNRQATAMYGCRAGSAWNPGKAHAAAVECYRSLAREYSVESAAAFAGLAREVTGLVPLQPPDRLRLELEEGTLLTQAGRDADGRAALREAARLAKEQHDAEALANVAAVFGLGYEHGNAQDVEVLSLIQEALDALPAGAHLWRARLLSRLAWQVLGSGGVEQRRRYAEEAVREASMAEDPAALAAAFNAHCWALALPGDLEERRLAADAVVSAARDAGDLDLELGGLMWQFRCGLEAGDLVAARAAAATFAEIVRRVPLPYHRWYADLFRGALAISDGDLDDALTAAQRIDPAATSQETQARVNFEALLGEIEIARGGDTRRLGVRRHFELLDGMLRMGWMVRPLLVALDQGPVAARGVLPGAVTIAASTPVDEDWLTMMSYLSIAAVLSDDRQSAAALIEPLRPYADQWIVLGNGAATRGPVSSFLAVLAVAAGMEEEATTFRARALASLRTASAPGLEFWLDLAPLPLRARTRASAAVSPREAEVLTLLARGHSNQEIANALVLSIRTVQRHVENLYRRLGVNNRAGATLAAVDLGLISPADVREAKSG